MELPLQANYYVNRVLARHHWEEKSYLAVFDIT
jgi:hypothetical protein